MELVYQEVLEAVLKLAPSTEPTYKNFLKEVRTISKQQLVQRTRPDTLAAENEDFVKQVIVELKQASTWSRLLANTEFKKGHTNFSNSIPGKTKNEFDQWEFRNPNLNPNKALKKNVLQTDQKSLTRVATELDRPGRKSYVKISNQIAPSLPSNTEKSNQEKPLPFLKKLSPKWLNYLALLDYRSTFDVYADDLTAEILEKYLLCVMVELCQHSSNNPDLCGPQGFVEPGIEVIKTKCYKEILENHTLWDQLSKYAEAEEVDESIPVLEDVEGDSNQNFLEHQEIDSSGMAEVEDMDYENQETTTVQSSQQRSPQVSAILTEQTLKCSRILPTSADPQAPVAESQRLAKCLGFERDNARENLIEGNYLITWSDLIDSYEDWSNYNESTKIRILEEIPDANIIPDINSALVYCGMPVASGDKINQYFDDNSDRNFSSQNYTTLDKLEKYLFNVEYLVFEAEAVKGSNKERCLLDLLLSYYFFDPSSAGTNDEVDRDKRSSDKFFLGTYAALSREKRQVLGIAALGTSIAALSIASYNAYQLKLLEGVVYSNQDEIQNLRYATETTLKGVEELESRANSAFRYLDRIAEFVDSQYQAQHIYNLLDRLDSFVKSASLFALNMEQSLEVLTVQERITPFFLDYNNAKRVIDEAKTALETMGAVLATENWHQVYRNRAIGIFHEDTKEINIVLGLPIKSRISDLNIYRASTIPIASRHSNLSYTLNHRNSLFISDSRIQLYREMTEQEFKTCKIFERSYFCDVPLIFETDQDTCLSRLFKNDLRNINRFCRFDVEKKEKLIIRSEIHLNRYCLLSSSRLDGQLYCRGQGQNKAEYIPQKQSLYPRSCVNLPHDCYWREIDQRLFIYGTMGAKMDIQIPSKSFDLNEQRLLDFNPIKFQANQFHATLETMKKLKPLRVIDAKSYIKKLHQHHVLSERMGNVLADNKGLIGLACVAILAVLAYFTYLCCRLKSVKRCFGRREPGDKLLDKLSPGFSILHKERKNNPKVLFRKATEKLGPAEIDQIRAFLESTQNQKDAGDSLDGEKQISSSRVPKNSQKMNPGNGIFRDGPGITTG